MEKKTVLEENADIYKKNHDTFNKKDFKNMSKKEKRNYFIDYYLKFVILGVVVLGLVIYVISTTFFNRTNTVLSIALVDESYDIDSDALQNSLQDFLEIESEKDVVTASILGSNDMYMGSALITRIAAGDVDLIVTNKETFERYASQGMFCDLQESLSTNIYSSISDQLVMDEIENTDEEGNILSKETSKAYGIDLSNNPKYKDFGSMMDSCILSVVANGNNLENAMKSIEYFVD